MDQKLTGQFIAKMRKEKGLTQRQLAEKLLISDKTVSKWENGKGYPDISLLEPLAGVLGVSVVELLSGKAVSNINVSANMMRSKFYVCPVCGNIIHSMGEAVIQCHGIMLKPCRAEETDESHMVFIERIEDEYYIRVEHDMTKQHYISFIAGVSSDKIQMVKLYPEGKAEARIKINGVRNILFYCNRDGLFSVVPVKGIDDKQISYDDMEERKALEQAAKVLLG